MKKWYKSKTYIVNILIAIIGILEVNQHLLLTTLGEHYGYFVIGTAIVGLVLREMTTERIG